MIRQGDVLLVPVDGVPKDAARVANYCTRPGGNRSSGVVAHGERTGHSHRLYADDLDFFTGKRCGVFVTVAGDGELVHQEHAPAPVPAGTYEVRKQHRTNTRGDAIAAAYTD